eukprot:482161_1
MLRTSIFFKQLFRNDDPQLMSRSQQELELKLKRIFMVLSKIDFMFVLRVIPKELLDVEGIMNSCKNFNAELNVSEVDWGDDHDVRDGLKIVINSKQAKFTTAHAKVTT